MKVKRVTVKRGCTSEPRAEKTADDLNGKYCIIRTYSAGVHAGYLESKDGKEVVLRNARRLWQWAGAFTLSEISIDGVSKPDECKFSAAVDKIILTEAIEIIPCSKKAERIIKGVNDYECE